MGELIGQSLGRYHILEQLGKGGMATVYKAYDTRLETDVAVKVIRTESLPQNAVDRALKRFEREAKALARLTHPNIVKVTDYGEYEGKPYLVMEYLPSGTLKSLLRGKPMPWQDAIRLLLPIARALGFAHRQGMIHRDVKPSNILITADGEPMLTDFGIAKMLDLEETMELTGTSAAIGTPEYMAPEQASSKSIDQRADIYALGVVFYEMVTGRKPYTADTPMAVIIKHASEPLPRPRHFVPDLPQVLENVLLKALAKKPDERYQSMGEFTAALERLLTGKLANEKKAKAEPKIVNFQTEKSNSDVIVLPTVSRRAVWTIGIIIVGTISIALLFPLIKSFPAKILPTSTRSFNLTPIDIITSTSSFPETTDAESVSMAFVPAGEFTMGSEKGDPDETPVHQVYLAAYSIDKYEVSNAFYRQCVNAEVCSAPGELGSLTRSNYYGNSQYDNYPVINVNWNMARTYCEWRGAKLPTEAQWEKAARGSNDIIYPWGNDAPNSTLLNYNENIGDTINVGFYAGGASPYGLYDMAGNVSEWVADWYDPNYYQKSPSSNPLGPDTGEFRVLRGGSWFSLGSHIRTSDRDEFNPSFISNYVGFRCSHLSP